ncbi:hypothetical protein A3843_05435 [Pseudovibrio exalbescens]|uniref:Uncharacterized protein n=1 Tax=Pseudovibrio exalbescens TaxID=197461 RepID=A0A1U7JK07_9HYPH|nr:hypothetical protein A3843_05435 [Pseudovibrio exalbescens]
MSPTTLFIFLALVFLIWFFAKRRHLRKRREQQHQEEQLEHYRNQYLQRRDKNRGISSLVGQELTIGYHNRYGIESELTIRVKTIWYPDPEIGEHFFYIDAYCWEVDEVRTFRSDRIDWLSNGQAGMFVEGYEVRHWLARAL